MENFSLPGISRELIVSKTGLVGFKRIHKNNKSLKFEVCSTRFASES